jgi:hypothetical protein
VNKNFLGKVEQMQAERNIVLTGLGRSGTTLTCHLLNKLPDTVALAEPIAPGKFEDLMPDTEAVCDGIGRFYRRMRRMARLELWEMALEQCKKMLRFPLTEEVVRREEGDGREVTIILRPARWNKNTIKSLFSIVTDDTLERRITKVAQELPSPRAEEQQQETIYLEDLSPQELNLVFEELKRQRAVENTGEAPQPRAEPSGLHSRATALD